MNWLDDIEMILAAGCVILAVVFISTGEPLISIGWLCFSITFRLTTINRRVGRLDKGR